MIKVIRGIGTLALAAIFVVIAAPVYLATAVLGSIYVAFRAIFDSPWG